MHIIVNCGAKTEYTRKKKTITRCVGNVHAAECYNIVNTGSVFCLFSFAFKKKNFRKKKLKLKTGKVFNLNVFRSVYVVVQKKKNIKGIRKKKKNVSLSARGI